MENEKKIRLATEKFVEEWRGKGYEKGQSQPFWLSLLRDVLGVERPETFIRFEEQVKLDHTSFIDAYIPETHVMIEQKGSNKDLRKSIPQSDGSVLSPFQQAKRYAGELPYSMRPRWIITCNFRQFLVYDMENPNGEPFEILLEDLPREYYRLRFITHRGNEHLRREMEVSMQAGEIVGRLYDALLAQYIDPSAPETLRSLNVLCVRLVFCLYAEDAGVFGRRDMFHDYLAHFDADDLREALIRLFSVLDQPIAERDPYLRDDLAAFPYCNGGLFRGDIEIPRLTDDIRNLLLEHASLDFDWSLISPTIFGAVFESTLNPETRRAGGMHYTSIENIHRVIDPLFFASLERQFSAAVSEPVARVRNKRLLALQEQLASLTFFDPACGSGNFLTETYLSLRRLENRIIREVHHGQKFIGVYNNPIRVSINQFYGIEINDFAVTVATTALWISESQMFNETLNIVDMDDDFLPLESYHNIRKGNALQIDWADVVPQKLDYIMGNPPFVGARLMSEEQKADLLQVFGKNWKNIGNMDYVCGWYKKAADLMQTKHCRTAFVSTNSITQGEQVANLWKPLFADGIHIDFARRTFRWDSEASLKAHVHCVIVGFSRETTDRKIIYDGEQIIEAENINAYLVDGPDICVAGRPRPLCDVPAIGIGNKPIDGGNYLFTREEMEDFIKREPAAAKFFRPWYGAEEFIHRRPRYCLWLGDCTPHELRSMPLCLERVRNVRELRLASKSAGTRKLADTPTRFHVENMPKSNYLLIPRISSEKRRYVPMGFMEPTEFTSDAVHIIPNATLYHFGVLESNVHMAWMRAVCGRLEMRYRYSKDIVYNNFPWPEPTDEQRAEIERTARGILDARAAQPDSSLADLYDELTMPRQLREAHRDNDRAVLRAYGFPTEASKMSESQCVAALFKLYQLKVDS